MTDTCDENLLTPGQPRQRRVLWIALTINAAMFAVEGGAALAAGSTSLLADAFDMLGDAAVYGISLYAVGRGLLWQSRAAGINGWLEIMFGIGVLADVSRRVVTGETPAGGAMLGVATLALAANLVCAGLLLAYRSQDINMRAVWLCTRNDAIANFAVIGAGALVLWSGAQWPDLVVGALLAALFLKTGIGLVRTARLSRQSVQP